MHQEISNFGIEFVFTGLHFAEYIYKSCKYNINFDNIQL